MCWSVKDSTLHFLSRLLHTLDYYLLRRHLSLSAGPRLSHPAVSAEEGQASPPQMRHGSPWTAGCSGGAPAGWSRRRVCCKGVGGITVWGDRQRARQRCTWGHQPLCIRESPCGHPLNRIGDERAVHGVLEGGPQVTEHIFAAPCLLVGRRQT